MSRTSGAPQQLAVFDHLVDDAAVFPPGLAPTDVAVREHLDLRDGPYAAQLGPLLVPATSAAEVAALAAADPRATGRPLRVGLIVRPGGAVEPLVEAVHLLRDAEAVEVATVELGWSPEWRRALDLDVPVVVEVGLGDAQALALDEIARAVDGEADVRAKFRTGQTESWPWPDEETLAGFLDAVVLRGLGFKLTGGLHHVVRSVVPGDLHGDVHGDDDGEPMHGLLNVLVATHEALEGDEAPALARTLAVTDVEYLVDRVLRQTPEDTARARASFTAYGCCGVLDPLTELEALGLLPERNRA